MIKILTSHVKTNETFQLCYWYSTLHYQQGGPVIVMQGGEGGSDEKYDSSSLVNTLRHHYLGELVKRTHALLVYVDHRFYGASIPDRGWETSNLRFLTTEQAVADSHYFATHAKFQLVHNGPDLDLAAPSTHWVFRGESYAGSVAAFARKSYPDDLLGAISSSGPTEAVEDYQDHWNAFWRIYPVCSEFISEFSLLIDDILLVSGHPPFVIPCPTQPRTFQG